EVTVSAHVGLDTTRCPTPFSAAFLPDTPPERLSVAFDLAGHELQPDEIAFCDFVGSGTPTPLHRLAFGVSAGSTPAGSRTTLTSSTRQWTDLRRWPRGESGTNRLVLNLLAADDASVTVQPSGTVTLVFTDIEGSTALLDELGAEAFKEALADHRRAVREAFGAHSGYEVDDAGDGLFYAFASASAAVTAVVQAMASLADGPVRIRVGVHTGEPLLDPPKYVGPDVHKAARIMSA